MPERHVEARFAAPPTAVLAALTARLHAQGDQLTGISGFGSEVTWNAFDGGLELVALRAQIVPDPDWPGHTLLLVRRGDPALDAALDTALDTGRPAAGTDRARLTG